MSLRSKYLNAIFSPTFLFFLALVVLFWNPGHEGHCAQVTLTWDPNSESDLAGYEIYYGTQSRKYQWNIDVGNVTNYTLSGLGLGNTYYFAATAYNTKGLESGYSNEVTFSVPSCTYDLSPSSASFSASGGSGNVLITTQAGCNWGTSSNASWVTINSGSGTGNGTMSYTVSPNTGITSQVASLTIAGNVFTVTEAGLPSYTVSISESGTGGGSVSTNPEGTTFAAGTQVTLTAIPDANSVFSGWSGACSGTTPICQVTVNSSLNITAKFSAVKNTPIVATGSATSVTPSSATLNGTINPYGLSTTYFFQWGPTASYGNTTAVQSAGSAKNYVAVSTNIISLTANMTYHYRIIVTNSAGKTYGSDGTFWTGSTGQIDFNNDGKTDILWRNKTTGNVGVWYLNGVTIAGSATIVASSDLNWDLIGTGDFNSDGMPDLLWRHKTTGNVGVWHMNRVTSTGTAAIVSSSDLNWDLIGTGDFNNDGMPDLLWRHKTTGAIAVWYMNGVKSTGTAVIASNSDLNWDLIGTGDFNLDGKPDLLWRNNTNGEVAVWYMNGVTTTGTAVICATSDLIWDLIGTGDFNSDGKPDMLWRNKTTGAIAVWYMNGVKSTGTAVIAPSSDLNWGLYAR